MDDDEDLREISFLGLTSMLSFSDEEESDEEDSDDVCDDSRKKDKQLKLIFLLIWKKFYTVYIVFITLIYIYILKV